jgi:hypothetical protein
MTRTSTNFKSLQLADHALEIDWLLSDMQEGDQTSVTLGLRLRGRLGAARP